MCPSVISIISLCQKTDCDHDQFVLFATQCLWSWRGREKTTPLVNFGLLKNCPKRFLPKFYIWGWKSPILGNREILSTRNLRCRKIATFCPPPTFVTQDGAVCEESGRHQLRSCTTNAPVACCRDDTDPVRKSRLLRLRSKCLKPDSSSHQYLSFCSGFSQSCKDILVFGNHLDTVMHYRSHCCS